MKINKMLPVPGEEQETVCVYEYETDSWNLYTCVRKHITRLLKIFDEADCSIIWKDENGRIVAIQIDDVDPSQVSFRNKSKKKEMSEEQKAKLAERLQSARKSKD